MTIDIIDPNEHERWRQFACYSERIAPCPMCRKQPRLESWMSDGTERLLCCDLATDWCVPGFIQGGAIHAWSDLAAGVRAKRKAQAAHEAEQDRCYSLYP